MSIWMNMEVAPAIAAAAVLVALVVLTSREIARLRDRARDLRAADDLLRMHQAAAAFVFNSERAPLKLRKKLLFFSETIFDRSRFIEVVKEVCLDNQPDSETRSFEKELSNLRIHDEALADAFETAIRSALFAMLLRDPLASHLARNFSIAKVAVDKKSELAAFTQAVRIGRKQDQPALMAAVVPA